MQMEYHPSFPGWVLIRDFESPPGPGAICCCQPKFFVMHRDGYEFLFSYIQCGQNLNILRSVLPSEVSERRNIEVDEF